MKVPRNHKALKVNLIEHIEGDKYIYHHPNGIDYDASICENFLKIDDVVNRSPFWAIDVIVYDTVNVDDDKLIENWIKECIPEYQCGNGDWLTDNNKDNIRLLIKEINKEWRKQHPIIEEKFTCESSSALDFLKS